MTDISSAGQKPIPSIILRAEMVTPRVLPHSLVSVFDRLGNYILPRIGIRIAFEFFETGWLIFFDSIPDFRAYFVRSNFAGMQESLGVERATDDQPLIWDFKFERVPPDVPEAHLWKRIRAFYAVPQGRGGGTFEEVSGSSTGKRYRVTRPSLLEYTKVAEGVIKTAHALFLSKDKTPKLTQE